MQNEVRVALYGGRGVGKSAIILKYIDGTFIDKYEPSIGGDYSVQKVDSVRGKFKLHIIDAISSRMETFMTDVYVATSEAIGFVYSITSPLSFQWIPQGMEEISKLRNSDAPFISMIIGNKVDLEENRKVTSEEGMAFAEKYNMPFVESSAKFNINVDRIFGTLLNYNFLEDSKKSTNKKCCVTYSG